MTHCTPSGAFFLGKLIPAMGVPDTIGNPDFIPHVFPGKANDADSDIFLKPNNWKPVLEKYPKLKVCFAHMGGVGEIWKKRTTQCPYSWYDNVKALMATYENLYTDISYTLFDKEKDFRTWREIRKILRGEAWVFQPHLPVHAPLAPVKPILKNVRVPPQKVSFSHTLKNRIMFGTDYFMTEQEDKEGDLGSDLPNWLLKVDEQGKQKIKEHKNNKNQSKKESGLELLQRLSEKNPERYLKSKFFVP